MKSFSYIFEVREITLVIFVSHLISLDGICVSEGKINEDLIVRYY